MSAEHLTILTPTGPDRGKIATKTIRRRPERWEMSDYSNATWWSIRQVEIYDLVSLGRALADLEHQPHSCVIRGELLPTIDLSCARRLKDRAEDGTPPSFASAARQWLGIDFDSLATPAWDRDKLARRRAAIARDRIEHSHHLLPPKSANDGEDYDFQADEDPAPIDPVRDWAICIKAAVITLPVEFHETSGYWQMTSSAGIKPGIRLRLWYWLDRPASDDEVKRWLAGSPVDLSLYSAVSVHYTSFPIFQPPGLDPVPRRSGFWWRHKNTIAVPDLREKVKPRPQTSTKRPFVSSERVERYAQACINSIVAAPDGQGRTKAIAVARLLYGMVRHQLLDDAKVTAALTDAMQNRGWGQTERGRWSRAEIERHLAYAKEHADLVLPEGFE